MSKFERLSKEEYNELKVSNQPKDQAIIIVDDVKGIIEDNFLKLTTEKDQKEFIEFLYDELGQTMRISQKNIGETPGKNPPIRMAKWKEEFWNKMGSIADHPRHKGKKIVFHPYSLNLDKIEKVISYCKENKLHLWMSGESRYFPGRSFKVNILPEKDKDIRAQNIFELSKNK